MSKLPTPQRIRELFLYDPHEGKLIRKSTGFSDYSTTDHGYGQVIIDGKNCKVHRVIWAWMTGSWPEHEIDHKNLNRNDNRWENLRHATRSQNKANSRLYRNSRSGFKGVQKIAEDRYRASLRLNGKYIHLGYFKCPKEAHKAYCKAGQKHFGEFFRAA